MPWAHWTGAISSHDGAPYEDLLEKGKFSVASTTTSTAGSTRSISSVNATSTTSILAAS